VYTEIKVYRELLLDNYSFFVFDCDGVVLNSNHVKTNAFYRSALPYGEATAQALVDYHVANGGISRYQKFDYFLEHLVPPGLSGPSREEMISSFSRWTRQGLLECDVAEGLTALREHTAHARWLIVSGGDQAELRKIFAQRDLAQLFDGGIFGSPDTKDEILAREVAAGNIQQPALFLGDSKYDHQAASAAGLDFVFLYNWSEVPDWRGWSLENNIKTKQSIKDLFFKISPSINKK